MAAFGQASQFTGRVGRKLQCKTRIAHTHAAPGFCGMRLKNKRGTASLKKTLLAAEALVGGRNPGVRGGHPHAQRPMRGGVDSQSGRAARSWRRRAESHQAAGTLGLLGPRRHSIPSCHSMPQLPHMLPIAGRAAASRLPQAAQPRGLASDTASARAYASLARVRAGADARCAFRTGPLRGEAQPLG
jgi:hypothetical protein